jgi:hypothetical protein
MRGGATELSTAEDGRRDGAVTAGAKPVRSNDDPKPAERPPSAGTAIVTIRSRKGAMLARLLEDMAPEELQRRGDAADELFREVVRRVAEGK